MKNNDEPTILVPTRLFKNLIDCLDAQKTLSMSNLDVLTRNQIQTLIDNTKEWALDVLKSKGESTQTVTDLQETLDFVKNERRIKATTALCDTESDDADSCSLSIVEPEDGDSHFL